MEPIALRCPACGTVLKPRQADSREAQEVCPWCASRFLVAQEAARSVEWFHAKPPVRRPLPAGQVPEVLPVSPVERLPEVGVSPPVERLPEVGARPPAERLPESAASPPVERLPEVGPPGARRSPIATNPSWVIDRSPELGWFEPVPAAAAVLPRRRFYRYFRPKPGRPTWAYVLLGFGTAAFLFIFIVVLVVVFQEVPPHPGEGSRSAQASPANPPRQEMVPAAGAPVVDAPAGDDVGNWQLVESEAGRFRVRMPAQPAVERRSMPSPVGPVRDTIYLLDSAQRSIGVSFADFDALGQRTEPLEKIVEAGARQIERKLSGRVVEEHDLAFEGHACHELIVDRPRRGLSCFRWIIVERRLYTVTIMDMDRTLTRREIDGFFDSFELTD